MYTGIILIQQTYIALYSVPKVDLQQHKAKINNLIQRETEQIQGLKLWKEE